MNIIIVMLGLNEKLIGDVEQLATGDLYIKKPYIISSDKDSVHSETYTIDGLKTRPHVDEYTLVYDIQECSKTSRITYKETYFSELILESNDEGFVIPIEKVLTLSEPKEELKEKYLQLIA